MKRFLARLGVALALVASVLTAVGLNSHPAFAIATLVASVSTGSSHVCAIDNTGTTYCWGKNNFGQVGDTTTVDKSVPTVVSGAPAFTSVVTGYYHSCGLTSAGAAYCWGHDGSNELGDNSSVTKTSPVAVLGGKVFTSLYAGGQTTCGLISGGAAYCWGDNTNGKVGDGTILSRTTPTAASGGLSFKTMAVGQNHVCGLTAAGAAYCWGDNANGQLGDGTNSASTSPGSALLETAVLGRTSRHPPARCPTCSATADAGSAIAGFTFTTLVAGGYTTCGLISSGAAYCWGSNIFDQIGDGTATSRNAPRAVSGGLTFTSIVTNQAVTAHTCGITRAGATYCWGYNTYGQIGNNSTTNATTPAAVSGGVSFTTVAAAGDSTCGLKAGVLYCWGRNANGQIGENSLSNEQIPVVAQLVFTNTNNQTLSSVTIDPSMTFTVGPHAGSCNGVPQTAGVGSSSSAVGLGHLTTGSAFAAQDLTVATNAGGGFTIYAFSVTGLAAGSHTMTSVSGTNLAPAAFPAAGTEAFGYTTSDSTLGTGTVDRFTNGGPFWAAMSTSNAEVSANLSPTGSDTACVGYRVQLATNTPAGDYTTSVIYTAIPTF